MVRVKGGNRVWFPHYWEEEPKLITISSPVATGTPVAADSDGTTFTCGNGRNIFFGYAEGNSPTGDLDNTRDYDDIEGVTGVNYQCTPSLFGLSSPTGGADTKYCYCRLENQEISYYNYTLNCPDYTPVNPSPAFSNPV